MSTRSSHDIEREIEEERRALASSLDRLTDQFSADRIVDTVARTVTDNGGELSRQVGRAMRDNPVGAALTGFGLAMLLTGGSSGSRARRPVAAPSKRREVDVPADPAHGQFGHGLDEAGRRTHYPPGQPDDFVDPPAATGTSGEPRAAYDTRPAAPAAGLNPEYDLADFDDRLAATDEDGDASLWGTIKERFSTMTDHREHDEYSRGMPEPDWQDRAESRYYRARAEYYRQKGRARATASEMRHSLESGLSDFSDEAKARIRKARLAAIDAQARIEHEMRYRGRQARTLARDNPLMLGLAAFAVGAIAAAALPRSRVEDEYLGHYRDRLVDEAHQVYAEESDKMKAVAASALKEGKEALKGEVKDLGETAKNAEGADDIVHAAASKGDKVASRVGEAARSTAEKKGVGSSVGS
jgi:hypothetical protein